MRRSAKYKLTLSTYWDGRWVASTEGYDNKKEATKNYNLWVKAGREYDKHPIRYTFRQGRRILRQFHKP